MAERWAMFLIALGLVGCGSAVPNATVSSGAASSSTPSTSAAQTTTTEPLELDDDADTSSSSAAPAGPSLGLEIDLRAALLRRDSLSTVAFDRSARSSRYEHAGRPQAADCAGLLRGQRAEVVRLGTSRITWYDPLRRLEQEVEDFGDVNLAIAHMEDFARVNEQCSATDWETGVPDVIAYEIADEDGGTYLLARIRREEVVSSIRLDVAGPHVLEGRRTEHETWFNAAAVKMVELLEAAPRRPISPPWPERFTVGEYDVELRDVSVEDDKGEPLVDGRSWNDGSKVYASFENGVMVTSFGLQSISDPHDPEDVDYTLSDYSGFGFETTVDGRQAIWERWWDEDEVHSQGFRLVWDATPEAYGWMQSRTLDLDEMKAIAAEVETTARETRWDTPSNGMVEVASDIFASEAEDVVGGREGVVATYDIELQRDDTEYAEIEIYLIDALPGEREVLRALAYEEKPIAIRGVSGHQLLIEPVSEYEDGIVYLVWPESETTTGIAVLERLDFVDALVDVVNHFDSTRTYD